MSFFLKGDSTGVRSTERTPTCRSSYSARTAGKGGLAPSKGTGTRLALTQRARIDDCFLKSMLYQNANSSNSTIQPLPPSSQTAFQVRGRPCPPASCCHGCVVGISHWLLDNRQVVLRILSEDQFLLFSQLLVRTVISSHFDKGAKPLWGVAS